MVASIPASVPLVCPREKFRRNFVGVDGSVTYRCSGCEWTYTLATQAPTSTSSAVLNAGGTAITVASGGAAFTNGMYLLFDTLLNTEVLIVNGAATGVSIPVAAAAYWPAVTGAVKNHLTAVTFGQLLISSTYAATGEEAVPAAPSWGF
jgi:hypothetical protein